MSDRNPREIAEGILGYIIAFLFFLVVGIPYVIVSEGIVVKLKLASRRSRRSATDKTLQKYGACLETPDKPVADRLFARFVQHWDRDRIFRGKPKIRN